MMRQTLMAASLIALWSGLSTGAYAEEPASGGEPPAGPPKAEAPAKPAGAGIESKLDKINYSLGYELGEDLRRDNLEAVPEVLLKGVADGLSGARPAVRTSERRAAVGAIKAKRAEENLEQSRAFLAENAKKEGVTTLESGLQYKELQPGEGKTPALDSRVTVNYRGTLIDGSEFDSSYARGNPAKLDVKRLIKGWREGLLLMKEGAKWELYVPPELGYGKAGRDKRIPPNSALIFEVELLTVSPAPAPGPTPERPRPMGPRDDGDE